MLKHDAAYYGERARALFLEGYNCAQAVVCAFAEETGLSLELSAKAASSFGGGMGRLREVCGAVSGALLVLGVLRGYSDPSDSSAKPAHYRLVQAFAGRFKEKHGSIVCRELLKGVPVTPGLLPEPRTPEFYKKRPCPELIRDAAVLTAELLSETEGKENT